VKPPVVAEAPVAKAPLVPAAKAPVVKPEPAAAAVVTKPAVVKKAAAAVVAKKPTTIVAVKKAPVSKPEPVVQMVSRQASLKDSYAEFAPEPTRGAWGQIFIDYERHEGFTLDGGDRGALTSKRLSGGVTAGMDWRVSGATGTSTKLLVGVLGGYSATHTDFNDVHFVNPTGDGFQRTNAKENVEGGGGGVYALLAGERFSADFMAKVDGYGLEQTDFVTADCANPPPTTRKGTVDFAVVTLASNIAYRYDLGANSFFEPTFGLRYTHASYGTQSGSLPLGFTDGDAFRIQGGARIGNVQTLPDGKVLVTSLLGMLYSDVSINGFSVNNGDGFNNAKVDEGKLRVMGQISAALVSGNGYTYTVSADVRGGEDVFGVGGKLGVRYEW
jgi:hypothetical protein